MFDFNSFPKAVDARSNSIKNVEFNHLAEIEGEIMKAQEEIHNAIETGYFYFIMKNLTPSAIDFLSAHGYKVKKALDNFIVSF